MTAPGQSEQQEDEEKAGLRQQIQQLEDAAARGEGNGQQAEGSQATDQERLDAALQQERLQARIHQLEVCCSDCPTYRLLIQILANVLKDVALMCSSQPVHVAWLLQQKGVVYAIVVTHSHGLNYPSFLCSCTVPETASLVMCSD